MGEPALGMSLPQRVLRASRSVFDGIKRAKTTEEFWALAPYVVASAVASLLPVRSYAYLGKVAGLIGYFSARTKRRDARAAQRLAAGPFLGRFALEIRTVAVFASYVRYWLESLAITSRDRNDLKVNLQVEGFQALQDWTSQSGLGAIVATAHLGNWDWGGSWVGSFMHPFAAVVEPLKPAVLGSWFFERRIELGIEPITLDGPVTRRVIESVKAGSLVALVSDRDLSGTGVAVKFFNRTVAMPSGAAVLSLRTKTPIFPGVVYMTSSGGHLVRFIDPIFPEAAVGENLADRVRWITQQVSTALESMILLAPTQWHVMQPLPVHDETF